MPAAASQPPIDADLLVVHSGQTYIKTVAAATVALNDADAELGRATAACRKGALLLFGARLRLWAARWGTHPALDATLLSSILGMTWALVTIFVFEAGFAVALGLLLFAYLCVGLPLAVLIWDRAGETDANRRQVRSDRVRQLLADAERSRTLARMAAATRDKAARLVPAVARAAEAMRARQWEAYQAELAAQQALAQAQLQADRTYQLSCV
jgi:signal transduction histidine kinase